MKLVFATLVLALSTSAMAYVPPPPGVPAWQRQDEQVSPNPIDRYPDRDLPGHSPRGEGGIAIASCAPEVVEGNVAATERTLTSLTRLSEFSSASTFRSQVAAIASTRSASAKVSKYFALIGVDASRSGDVADFVGARSVDSRWVSALQRNSGLSTAQADLVASKLQTALRGSLQ